MSSAVTSESNWIFSDIGVVALLDSLGTKGIWSTTPPDQVFTKWSALLDLVDAAAHDLLADPEVDKPGCEFCQPISFSDTLYIPMIPTARNEILDTVLAMGQLLSELIWTEILDGIFLRGTVSAGVFYQSETKIFGPAADEAASWYELPDWIGVTATPTMERLLDLLVMNEVDVSSYYVKCEVPYKEGRKVLQWCLDWPRYAASVSPESNCDLLEAFFEFAGVVTPEVRGKYTNTIEFFQERMNGL